METYDVIVVLGSQPDPKTWEFPKQIYKCLNNAKALLNQDVAPYIILAGDRGIKLDNCKIRQPFRECDKMADYLIERGVQKSKLLKEGKSRDTISNIYYIKTKVLIPKRMHRLLFVVAEFRTPRLKFLCKRILGSEYSFDFEPIAAKVGSTYNEPHTFKIQSEFLEPMKDGDHAWLDGKFYTAPMYKYWRKWDREQAKRPPKRP